MLHDEEVVQEVALGNDGHDDHRKARREIEEAVSTGRGESRKDMDMTNSHFTGASMRLRM